MISYCTDRVALTVANVWIVFVLVTLANLAHLEITVTGRLGCYRHISDDASLAVVDCLPRLGFLRLDDLLLLDEPVRLGLVLSPRFHEAGAR